VLYYYNVHNQRIVVGLDIEVNRLREENAQVAAERDWLTEEKTKWLETQQTMKEEKAKLTKDLKSKYSSALS
jgi:hypothetical protein